ncbi:MAG: DUF1566 domain-containing protein [Chromatiaceae bacterium]|nr:DUF1566 domain-containing protein [Chromatiaceae bacterium]
MPTWPLNDTGIDWCANVNTNYLACPVAGYPWQDAEEGRDATQDHDADGHAGFAFTKLDANGGALLAGASDWSCVRDNITGLIWEVKTDDGGLRDKDWSYSWYNPDPAANGGSAGYPDRGNNCYDTTRCDTAKFAADVNQAGLCGASDWRLPTVEELLSIVDYSGYSPAIDSAWFPNTLSSWYWSSSPVAYLDIYAWIVYFDSGTCGYGFYKSDGNPVRLVRGGQASPPPTALLGPSGGPSNPTGSAAEPVNTATGNYYYQHPDLTLPGRGLGLAFTRTYNTQDATVGPFGRGWTHSYQVHLTENADGSVIIRHGDGHETFYDRNLDGTYSSRYPGVHDRLDKQSATSFLLTAKDQTRHAFTNGYLTQLSDRNGNALTFAYDGAGHLTGITDTAGRVVTLSYDANGRLLQLSGPLGRTVQYAYDVNGDLVADTDPAGGIMRYSYNGDRRLIRITNRRGQILIDNVYDGAGRVVAQTNGRGLVTTFAWDSPNPGDTTITNPLGEATIHRHDSQRRLLAEIDPLGHSIQYGYDASNNRIQVTDRNGQVTAYSYDARGNVLTQTDALGGVTTLTYDVGDNPLTRTDALGQVTSYGYDAAGNLLTETDPLGQTTSYGYDAQGQRLSRTDGNSHTTMYAYDAQGNRTAITNPLGQTTHTAYDAAGRPIGVTDANGHATTLAYDGNDRLLTTTDALGHTVALVYDPDGNRTQITDAKGQTSVTVFDANDQVLSVTDPTGAVTASSYDAADQRLTQTDPLGNLTEFGYDAGHRLIAVTDALNQVTSYSYDANGNRLSQTDPLGQIVTSDWDALNRLTRVTDPLGNATAWQYDALGRRMAMTDAQGRITAYDYDALGRLVQVTDPAGNSSYAAYDAVGNRLSVTNPNGQSTGYAYDAADRRLSETNALNQVTAWQYDAVGNPTRRTDAKGQVTQYGYDVVNRLASIHYADATTVAFSQDANGNLTQMVDPLGTTLYRYDARNRLTGHTDPFGNTIGHDYDAAGNRRLLIYPDNKRVGYDYDALNRLASVTDWLGNTTQYGYDAVGNLTGRYNDGAGTEALFDYDAASRLASTLDGRTDTSVIARYDLTLDAVGNRTAIARQDPVAPGYVSQNTLAVYDDADRLTNLGGSPVSHDDNGNLLSQPGGSYQYDGDNRLIVANAQHYAYDGQGHRLAATRSGVITRYVLDLATPLSQVLMERDSAGSAVAYYIHGLGLIARISPSGDARYYHYDANGNTVALSDAGGLLTDAYAYSPFGEPLAQQGSTPNPFRFLGQFGVQQEGNGLNFVRARYYHPATGRFLSKDPVSGKPESGQTLNHYAYALNNPVRFVDVSGLSAKEGSGASNVYGPSDELHSGYLANRTEIALGARNHNNEKDHWLNGRLKELWLKELPLEFVTDYAVSGLEAISPVGGAVVGQMMSIFGIVTTILAETPEIVENWTPVIKDIQEQKKGAQPTTSGGVTWRISQCDARPDWEECTFGP